MRAEDRILFACTRQELLPEHSEAVAGICRQAEQAGRPIDWERLVATAERQGVAPIVGWNLQRCAADTLGLPPALALRLELARFENAAIKERDAARLTGALAHLAAGGLEAMLLKGAALDLLVYTQPGWVVSRDIDLVVRRRRGESLPRGDWEVRRPLYAVGIECDFLTHHDVTMNGLLPVRFERIWRDARPVEVRGEPALVMAPEDLVISLAINACRKRFLRLKEMFALAESVRRLDLDWSLLAARAREDCAEGIVYTALLVTRETLGCPLPPEALSALDLPAARQRLLRLLLGALLAASSLTHFEGGRSGLLGRRLNLSLLLPYACYRRQQLVRSLRLATGYHRPLGTAPAPS
ncbi:MAG TPA: nucleotidyltransferase family protein [Thermoanaerobaculia bacterium]|nr:nucleotidyltransferase family protein [Thermoanaerobaculia bacterium]